jgi:hypothetical protein
LNGVHGHAALRLPRANRRRSGVQEAFVIAVTLRFAGQERTGDQQAIVLVCGDRQLLSARPPVAALRAVWIA